MADMPDRHTLLIVIAGISFGIPAAIDACRAVICPCPAWMTCPMTVYSTWSASMAARSSAERIAAPPRSTARIGARPPRNFPMGVRAPATKNERVMCGVYERDPGWGSGAVRERLLDDLEDLVADELVVLHQGVAERLVDVAVLGEHLPDALALAVEDVLHALLRLGVAEHLAHEVRVGEGSFGNGLVTDQGTRHPEGAHHLGRERRGRGEVGARPRPRLAEAHLLGGEPSKRDRDAGLEFGLRPGEALLLVAVREQPQRAATLDDGQHLEPPPDTDQVGNGGVPRFMGRDGVSIGLRVVGHLLGADLLGELRLHHIFEVHPLASLAE